MKPDHRFCHKSKAFWASVRTLGQAIGYTVRASDKIRVPTYLEMSSAFEKLGLNQFAILVDGNPTPFALELYEYFEYRALVLEQHVQALLMTADEAKMLFEKVRACRQLSQNSTQTSATAARKVLASLS